MTTRNLIHWCYLVNETITSYLKNIGSHVQVALYSNSCIFPCCFQKYVQQVIFLIDKFLPKIRCCLDSHVESVVKRMFYMYRIYECSCTILKPIKDAWYYFGKFMAFCFVCLFVFIPIQLNSQAHHNVVHSSIIKWSL